MQKYPIYKMYNNQQKNKNFWSRALNYTDIKNLKSALMCLAIVGCISACPSICEQALKSSL